MSVAPSIENRAHIDPIELEQQANWADAVHAEFRNQQDLYGHRPHTGVSLLALAAAKVQLALLRDPSGEGSMPSNMPDFADRARASRHGRKFARVMDRLGDDSDIGPAGMEVAVIDAVERVAANLKEYDIASRSIASLLRASRNGRPHGFTRRLARFILPTPGLLSDTLAL